MKAIKVSFEVGRLSPEQGEEAKGLVGRLCASIPQGTSRAVINLALAAVLIAGTEEGVSLAWEAGEAVA